MAARPRDLYPDRSARDFFGAEMRRHRMSADLSLVQLGAIVNYSKSFLADIELAERTVPAKLPELLDAAFGTDGHFGRLYELARREPHPGKYRRFMELEARAVAIEEHATQTIPGLLQTEDYSRALLRVGDAGLPEEEFEARVAARMARQELLRSPMRPEFWAILDEAVLRRPVGGPTRMCDQLAALLPLMNTRHTTIQVLPFRHGEHALLNTNLFLLTLPNNSVVGYEESGWSGQLIDDEQAVRERKRAYDALKAYALSPSDSATLIRAVMEEYEPCESPPA